MSVRSRKEYDGFRGKIHGERIREIPCYLIGQLARNSCLKREDVSGKDILETALSVIASASSVVGGRWLLVECHNEHKLLDFYSQNGFQYIMNEPDGDVPMVQMIRRI